VDTLMKDRVQLSVAQFTEAWRVLCSAAPGYVFHEEPGLQYVFSGVPLLFFNAAVLTGTGLSAGDLEMQAGRASTYASEMNCPWILIVTEDAVAPGTDISAALDVAGFAPLIPLTGMLADQVAPPEHVPDELVISGADDDECCAAVLDVNSSAYAMCFDAGRPIWGIPGFWKKHSAAIGRVEGKPVCTATVMNADGYRYVALVATEPGHQRRRYADAVMRHALELSRKTEGDLPTFLHATDAGFPVYQRLGYEAVARHIAFVPKQFLAAH
jgi:GNAT superfamily N-acetyltransferase